jgi:hypothetical protein
LFALGIFHASWGHVGVGPVINLVPSGSSGGTFQIGPAGGVVAKAGPWKLGFFLRNLFGADVARSILEPILSYSVTSWFSVGCGQLEFEVDWWNGKLVEAPLGVELTFVPTVGGQKVHLWVNPRVNLADSTGNFQWRVTFGFSLVSGD